MGTLNMMETIKVIHKEDVVLVKVGTFYTAYGKDAYIINYLFNYKLNKTQDVYTSAFPISSLARVTAILEQKSLVEFYQNLTSDFCCIYAVSVV